MINCFQGSNIKYAIQYFWLFVSKFKNDWFLFLLYFHWNMRKYLQIWKVEIEEDTLLCLSDWLRSHTYYAAHSVRTFKEDNIYKIWFKDTTQKLILINCWANIFCSIISFLPLFWCLNGLIISRYRLCVIVYEFFFFFALKMSKRLDLFYCVALQK